MKQDRFFDRVKDWSARKHRLLGKYLPPFSAKLGSWNPVVYCIDGFAGAGKYGDEKSGSPLITARLSDECASWKKPVELRIINIEAKPIHYEALAESTREWATRGAVDNRRGKFGQLLPGVLKDIGNAPALFFVDPYGPSKIPFDDLAPILRRTKGPTELLINFDGDGLRRMGDRIQRNVKTERGLKAAETTIAVVTRIVGSDSWKAQFETGKLSSEQREALLLKTYEHSLAKFNFSVVHYPIRKSRGKRAEYYLIFCTRHWDGIELWNDFISEEEDQMFDESVIASHGDSLFLPGLEPVTAERTLRRDELRPLVLNYFRAHKQTTRGEIKRHMIAKNFGMFHRKDYNAVVQGLVDDGDVKTAHGRKMFNDEQPLTYVGT